MLETVIILILTVADQLVKIWAAGPLRNLHGGDLPLINGVFHFAYVENRGAAFGMLQNAQVFFLILTTVALVALTVYLFKKRRTMGILLRMGLTLIFAGGLGNLIDRVLLGYVRDMFDFRLINFAVFNVADICVTIGGGLVILFILLDEFKQRKHPQEVAAEPAEPSTEPFEEPEPAFEEPAQTAESAPEPVEGEAAHAD